MSDPDWRAGYALLARHNLSFDLKVPWWHLPEAAELAERHPATTLIVDHAAMPDNRTAEGLAGWRRAIEIAARQPNIVIKISGLGHYPGVWPTDGNVALVRAMVDVFGIERCMVASNYPVDRLVAPLDHIYATFLRATAMYGQAAQRALFLDNARRIYRVDEGAAP